MTWFLEQHFSVAVLCNSAETDPSGLARQVADVLGGEKLTVRLNKADRLRPAVRDVFNGQIGAVRFTRDPANGHVSGFVLNAGRIQNLHFAKRAN